MRITVKGWWVQSFYKGYFGDEHEGPVDVVYAPTQDLALQEARIRWPTSCAWEVLGHQSTRDPEICRPAKIIRRQKIVDDDRPNK